MTVEIMCFQFSPKHCQWWSRCNVIRKTVPQLWASRSQWLFPSCNKTRRTDSKLVGSRRVKSTPWRHASNAAQPIWQYRCADPQRAQWTMTASLDLVRLGAWIVYEWKLVRASVMGAEQIYKLLRIRVIRAPKNYNEMKNASWKLATSRYFLEVGRFYFSLIADVRTAELK